MFKARRLILVFGIGLLTIACLPSCQSNDADTGIIRREAGLQKTKNRKITLWILLGSGLMLVIAGVIYYAKGAFYGLTEDYDGGPVIMLSALMCVCSIPGLSQSTSYNMATEEAILLSRYIQKKSVSGLEKEAGEFLADICRDKGLIVEKLSSPVNSCNFAASLFPLSDNKPNIIFLNHIDVVPEGNTDSWLHEPFSGIIADNSVWGRGALDLKGVAIMQLMAIERQNNGREKRRFRIMLHCFVYRAKK